MSPKKINQPLRERVGAVMANPAEDTSMDAPCYVRTEARVRFGDHAEVFGRGRPLMPRMRILLLYIWLRMDEAIKGFVEQLNVVRGHIQLRANWDRRALFTALTGFSHQRAHETVQEMELNNGYVFAPGKTGPKGVQLEVESPEFSDWLDNLANGCITDGRPLTIPRILEEWEEYSMHSGPQMQRPNENQIEKAIKRLGYKYIPRSQCYISKKNTAENIAHLKANVDWVFDSVEQGADGRYNYIHPTCFQDEASVRGRDYSSRSWCKPGLNNHVDNPRGGHVTIHLCSTVFSHKSAPNARQYWNHATKATATKFGGRMTSDQFLRYIAEYVCVEFEGVNHPPPVIYIDNDGSHTAFKEDLRKKTAVELASWIDENAPDAQKLEFNTLATGRDLTRKEIFEFIRQRQLRQLKIEETAALYGCVIRRGTPYRSPMSPQEYIWAMVKPSFKKLSFLRPWQERMAMAFSGVSRAFELKCIDRSIRWCLEMREELMEAAAGNPGDGVIQIAVGDDSPALDVEEDSADELDDD